MPPRTLAADTKLSAGGAFALNACFVAGLLVLSQRSSLQQRATVRTSIIVPALLLLAWIESRQNSTRAPASRVGLPPAGFQ